MGVRNNAIVIAEASQKAEALVSNGEYVYINNSTTITNLSYCAPEKASKRREENEKVSKESNEKAHRRNVSASYWFYITECVICTNE